MAIGESKWADLPPIKGVKLGVIGAGIKYANRNDVGVILLDEGATVAGVFTQNSFAAAPVHICRAHLEKSKSIRALITNSGNANACTGEKGFENALRSCELVAGVIGAKAEQVLPFSTGVIGQDLPIEKIAAVIPSVCEKADEASWFDFAKCIMTTDTRPKGATKTIEWQGETITINGVSKGSGMINPNMATMLAYVATDAKVAADVLQHLINEAAYQSFNRITIDGDTSTNDSCVLMASGASTAQALNRIDDPLYPVLSAAIVSVFQSLAKEIVLDGEGATKFVEVNVQNGQSNQECLDVAYAIAHSPLIKTALFASDPNWGRIVCAIGNAGLQDFDASKIKVWLDDVLIVENGGRAASYKEEDGQAVFNKEFITIRVDLARGSAAEYLWTTDLSHEYIRINAEYRS